MTITLDLNREVEALEQALETSYLDFDQPDIPETIIRAAIVKLRRACERGMALFHLIDTLPYSEETSLLALKQARIRSVVRPMEYRLSLCYDEMALRHGRDEREPLSYQGARNDE